MRILGIKFATSARFEMSRNGRDEHEEMAENWKRPPANVGAKVGYRYHDCTLEKIQNMVLEEEESSNLV